MDPFGSPDPLTLASAPLLVAPPSEHATPTDPRTALIDQLRQAVVPALRVFGTEAAPPGQAVLLVDSTRGADAFALILRGVAFTDGGPGMAQLRVTAFCEPTGPRVSLVMQLEHNRFVSGRDGMLGRPCTFHDVTTAERFTPDEPHVARRLAHFLATSFTAVRGGLDALRAKNQQQLERQRGGAVWAPTLTVGASNVSLPLDRAYELAPAMPRGQG